MAAFRFPCPLGALFPSFPERLPQEVQLVEASKSSMGIPKSHWLAVHLLLDASRRRGAWHLEIRVEGLVSGLASHFYPLGRPVKISRNAGDPGALFIVSTLKRPGKPSGPNNRTLCPKVAQNSWKVKPPIPSHRLSTNTLPGKPVACNYGLLSVNDERLYRTFNHQKPSFLQAA